MYNVNMIGFFYNVLNGVYRGKQMNSKETECLYKNCYEKDKNNKYRFIKSFIKKFNSLPREKIIAIKVSLLLGLFLGFFIIINDLIIYISPNGILSTVKYKIIKGSFYLIVIPIFLYLIVYKNTKKVILSEREVSKKVISESEESYRKLVELLPNAIHVKHKGRIIFTNKAGAKLYGFNNIDELIGKSDSEFTHPDYQHISKSRGKKVLEENKSVPLIEVKCIKADGEIIDVEVISNSITLNGEKVILSVLRDITDIKKSQKIMKKTLEENKKLLEKTIEHDRLKTEYFSNISHEFKTPLNVILGSVQLLEIYKNNDFKNFDYNKLSKNIFVMKQNCYRLLRLINNILDINKVDMKFLELNLKSHNIVKIIEDVTLSVAKFIENKGISLIFDTETEEKIMMCDVDKIERIILNLLSNSIKYNNVGGNIYVDIYDKKDHIIISVKDTGVGIPKDKIDSIFERFRRIDSSLSRANEGSGIGLSIVKSFVEKHGGEISIESEVGKGTQFFIKLPVIIEKEECCESKCKDYSSDVIERINIEFSDIYL